MAPRRAGIFLVLLAIGSQACGTRVRESVSPDLTSVVSRPDIPGAVTAVGPVGRGADTAHRDGAAPAGPEASSGRGTPRAPANAGGVRAGVSPDVVAGAKVPGVGATSPTTAPTRASSPSVTMPRNTPADARSPITIGSVGTLSGPVGGALVPLVRALQVWVKDVNQRGGVAGHRVDLQVGDDGGDPARNKALVQEFVERRNVLAFVGMAGVVTGQASFEYLSTRRIPVVGSDTGADYFYDSPTYFPQGPHGFGVLQTQAAAAMDALPAGAKVASLTCVEAQVCEDAARLHPKVAEQYRVSISYAARISLAQPDFTAECLNAARSGAGVMIVTADGATVQRVAGSCARQGYKPTFALGPSAATEAQLKDPNMQGAVVGTNFAPWVLNSTAGLQAFHTAFATYDRATIPNGAALTGWAAAKLFEAATIHLPERPTRQSVLDGLWAIRNDDLGGITYPLTFERDKPARRVFCYWKVVITDGAFTARNTPPTCPPAISF